MMIVTWSFSSILKTRRQFIVVCLISMKIFLSRSPESSSPGSVFESGHQSTRTVLCSRVIGDVPNDESFKKSKQADNLRWRRLEPTVQLLCSSILFLRKTVEGPYVGVCRGWFNEEGSKTRVDCIYNCITNKKGCSKGITGTKVSRLRNEIIRKRGLGCASADDRLVS